MEARHDHLLALVITDQQTARHALAIMALIRTRQLVLQPDRVIMEAALPDQATTVVQAQATDRVITVPDHPAVLLQDLAITDPQAAQAADRAITDLPVPLVAHQVADRATVDLVVQVVVRAADRVQAVAVVQVADRAIVAHPVLLAAHPADRATVVQVQVAAHPEVHTHQAAAHLHRQAEVHLAAAEEAAAVVVEEADKIL